MASEAGGAVDGTVLEDQVAACDEIIEGIVDAHEGDPDADVDAVLETKRLYERVRQHSLDAFDDRFSTSSLYDSLKIMLRRIGEERGYEGRLHYMNRSGKNRVADNVQNSVNWFRLYASVVLNRPLDLTYDWAVPHFKQHRDLIVSHPTTMDPLRDRPDPTLVSSVVPLWFVLEDLLRGWRAILDTDDSHLADREAILRGEQAPLGKDEPYRYGFVRELQHRSDQVDVGYITGYQNGENGKNSRFDVHDVDFFVNEGDVVRFRAEQRTNRDGEEFGALTVTELDRFE